MATSWHKDRETGRRYRLRRRGGHTYREFENGNVSGDFVDAHVGPLTFAAMMKALRDGEEETQSNWAERLGITKQYVSDVENGRRVPSPGKAVEWAEKLGYSPAQFVRLILQAQVDRLALPFHVHLEPDGKAA